MYQKANNPNFKNFSKKAESNHQAFKSISSKNLLLKLVAITTIIVLINIPSKANAQFENYWSDWFTQPDLKEISSREAKTNQFELGADGTYTTMMSSNTTDVPSTFGGADPGFGFGNSADTPPDTPIDGGLSVLFAAGIGSALKSMKKKKKRHFKPSVDKQLNYVELSIENTLAL